MTYERLQRQWQEQPGRISIDESLLLKHVRRSKESFEAGIFWRDVREGGVGLAMSVLFFYFGLKQHMWTHYVLSAGCFFVAVFLWVDRRRQKSRQPHMTDTVQDCLRGSLAQTEHQIHLLKNVLWWYLLPIMAGGILVGGHTAIKLYDGWQDVLRSTLTSAAIWMVVGLGVWWLNRIVARRVLEPQRRELAALLDSLSEA